MADNEIIQPPAHVLVEVPQNAEQVDKSKLVLNPETNAYETAPTGGPVEAQQAQAPKKGIVIPPEQTIHIDPETGAELSAKTGLPKVPMKMAVNEKTGEYETVIDTERAQQMYEALGEVLGKKSSPSAAAPTGGNETNSAPKPKEKFSPLRNHPNHCAGKVVIEEVTYFYKEMSDNLKEWIDERPKYIAERLGVSTEALLTDRFAADTPVNREGIARLAEGQRPELANAEEMKKIPRYLEEGYDKVLAECLIHCDYPGVDFSAYPELKKQLALTIKAALVKQIRASSDTGLTQQSFF